jgi:hypothetical protein
MRDFTCRYPKAASMSIATRATAIHPNGTLPTPPIPPQGSIHRHRGASHQDDSTPLDADTALGRVAAAIIATVEVEDVPKLTCRPDLTRFAWNGNAEAFKQDFGWVRTSSL